MQLLKKDLANSIGFFIPQNYKDLPFLELNEIYSAKEAIASFDLSSISFKWVS